MKKRDKEAIRLMVEGLRIFQGAQAAVSREGFQSLNDMLWAKMESDGIEGLPTWNEINAFTDFLDEATK